MNKCTLFFVFFCGAVFSGLVSILKTSINLDRFVSNFYPTGIGILPPGADLEAMDDGYVAMAKLDATVTYFNDMKPDLTMNEESTFKILKKGKVTDLEERSFELEALNSLKVAVELVAAGKSARAGRLLEHAHSLAPRHPDVLLIYGEYLEEHTEDIVQADHMFLKALTISPSSSHALRNRQRTQAVVEKLDISMLDRIDSKRNELALIPPLSGSLRRIKREAYFQHIYHTAAIEGNTLTLAQIRMILETGLSVGGKSVMEHNEILGVDLALKYINTTLVHRVGKITLKDILEIHRRVLGHVDPLGAGTMRTTQVFVSDHVPPHPSKIELLMEGFVLWLNSEEGQKLHPIKYAALAHYKLVFIHPFVDGNGRTARLLMNFLLMQAGYPPVIIRKQDRLHYYNHLQTANDGDTRPFIRFIARCMDNTIDVYLWATKEHLPEIEQKRSTDYTESRQQNSVEKAKLTNMVTFLHDIGDISMPMQDDTSFTLDDTVYATNQKLSSELSHFEAFSKDLNGDKDSFLEESINSNRKNSELSSDIDSESEHYINVESIVNNNELNHALTKADTLGSKNEGENTSKASEKDV